MFADGYVIANPHNKQYGDGHIQVNDGSIDLPKCYSVIHVGLPITADIETLDIDTAQGGTVADKNKLATSVMLWLDKTRGGFVGPKPPPSEDEDFLGGLVEFKPRSKENYSDTPALKTGVYELQILPEWNSNGRIFIRQTDPLPMSILAVASVGVFPVGG